MFSTLSLQRMKPRYLQPSKSITIVMVFTKAYLIILYFLVHRNGQINALKSPISLNVYIPETFDKVLKRNNDKILFYVLVKH